MCGLAGQGSRDPPRVATLRAAREVTRWLPPGAWAQLALGLHGAIWTWEGRGQACLLGQAQLLTWCGPLGLSGEQAAPAPSPGAGVPSPAGTGQEAKGPSFSLGR